MTLYTSDTLCLARVLLLCATGSEHGKYSSVKSHFSYRIRHFEGRVLYRSCQFTLFICDGRTKASPGQVFTRERYCSGQNPTLQILSERIVGHMEQTFRKLK
jgi:hypothetical protein